MGFVNRRLMVVMVLGLLGFTCFGCSTAEKVPQASNEAPPVNNEAPRQLMKLRRRLTKHRSRRQLKIS